MADGDSPCLAVDEQGNPHCLFRDGNTISYARRVNNVWEGPFILYEDDFAMEFSVPSFIIYGNTGYLAFEFQNQWMTSYLVFGTFDITAQDPSLQHINIDTSNSYRFGAPGLVLRGGWFSFRYLISYCLFCLLWSLAESVHISNNPVVDSRTPDFSYLPAQFIEGKIVITYTEGNEHWSEPDRRYLPIYRLKT